MKWLKKFFVATVPPSRPLGRWSHCGDKKSFQEDVLEFKIRQKARRQSIRETGTDPYRKPQQLCPTVTPREDRGHTEQYEEYMRPFVVQS